MRTKNKPSRYDLDKVYRYSQYNKTKKYGKDNINVGGVREQLGFLENERAEYERDVRGVTDPARDREADLFALCETRRRKKEHWFTAGKIVGVLVILDLFFDNKLPISMRTYVGPLLLLAVIVVVPAMLYMAARARLTWNKYDAFIAPIAEQLRWRGAEFEKRAQAYYQNIDDLYLASLEPAMREVVLLRREQEAHNKEMARLEQERLNHEKAALTEARKAREAQERLLAIEEARERERRGW